MALPVFPPLGPRKSLADIQAQGALNQISGQGRTFFEPYQLAPTSQDVAISQGAASPLQQMAPAPAQAGSDRGSPQGGIGGLGTGGYYDAAREMSAINAPSGWQEAPGYQGESNIYEKTVAPEFSYRDAVLGDPEQGWSTMDTLSALVSPLNKFVLTPAAKGISSLAQSISPDNTAGYDRAIASQAASLAERGLFDRYGSLRTMFQDKLTPHQAVLENVHRTKMGLPVRVDKTPAPKGGGDGKASGPGQGSRGRSRGYSERAR